MINYNIILVISQLVTGNEPLLMMPGEITDSFTLKEETVAELATIFAKRDRLERLSQVQINYSPVQLLGMLQPHREHCRWKEHKFARSN